MLERGGELERLRKDLALAVNKDCELASNAVARRLE